MTKQLLLSLLVVAGAAVANAADAGKTTTSNASAAFERLKTLAGEWDGSNGSMKGHISYELIAGGTALVERETGEGMPPMMTVYHLDGDRLVLTHYCMLGNQPRLQARRYDTASGELAFEFLDATGLPNSKASHMHNATFHFIDSEHFSSSWQLYENGEPRKSEQLEYTRVK